MVFKEIVDDKMLYMDLLLLADEQEDMIHRYLERLTIKSQARNAEERQKFRRFKRGIAKLTSFWTPT